MKTFKVALVTTVCFLPLNSVAGPNVGQQVFRNIKTNLRGSGEKQKPEVKFGSSFEGLTTAEGKFSARVVPVESSAKRYADDFEVQTHLVAKDGNVTKTKMNPMQTNMRTIGKPEISNGLYGQVRVSQNVATIKGQAKVTQELSSRYINGRDMRQVHYYEYATDDGLKITFQPKSALEKAAEPARPGVKEVPEYTVDISQNGRQIFRGDYRQEHRIGKILFEENGNIMTVWAYEGTDLVKRSFQLSARDGNSPIGSFVPRTRPETIRYGDRVLSELATVIERQTFARAAADRPAGGMGLASQSGAVGAP